MRTDLTSIYWPRLNEVMRMCHLTSVDPESADELDWQNAFVLLKMAIEEERKANPHFAPELADLSEATGNEYGYYDILEEFFNHMEDNHEWEEVIRSCETMINLFQWKNKYPSEYMFRKGNALEKSGRYEEAEAFGSAWLEQYPDDLYAAASNVFLKIELGKFEEAETLTYQYLSEDLICDNTTDTFFMAAFRLFEMTDNINAKQRVEKKMAEYSALVDR